MTSYWMAQFAADIAQPPARLGVGVMSHLPMPALLGYVLVQRYPIRHMIQQASPLSAIRLKQNLLRVARRLRFGFLQHLVAEQRSGNAHVQAVNTDLVDFATMRNSDLVMRQIQETAPQPRTFSPHHQNSRVFCHGRVVGGEPFRTPRNSVDYFTGPVVFRLGRSRDGGRWCYSITRIDPPPSPRTLPEEVGWLPDFEQGNRFGGARRGFERNMAPRRSLARGRNDCVDTEEIG